MCYNVWDEKKGEGIGKYLMGEGREADGFGERGRGGEEKTATEGGKKMNRKRNIHDYRL